MADRQFCYKDKNNVLAGLQCRDRDRGVWETEGSDGWSRQEEEEVGKVGRVALNKVAIHSNFRVCALVLAG